MLSKDYYNLLERTVNGETESFIYDNNVASMSKSGNNYYYLQDEIKVPDPNVYLSELTISRMSLAILTISLLKYGTPQGIFTFDKYRGHKSDHRSTQPTQLQLIFSENIETIIKFNFRLVCTVDYVTKCGYNKIIF